MPYTAAPCFSFFATSEREERLKEMDFVNKWSHKLHVRVAVNGVNILPKSSIWKWIVSGEIRRSEGNVFIPFG